MMSPQRMDFEEWYKRECRNFTSPQVIFDSDSNSYSDVYIDLAWKAWIAGGNAFKKFVGGVVDAKV